MSASSLTCRGMTIASWDVRLRSMEKMGCVDQEPVFEAPWSKALWISSTVATMILLGVSALPLPEPGWIRLLPLAFLLVAVPFVVRRYEIQNGVLLIRRLWWNTRIDLSGLQSARLDPHAMRGIIRTCANGGVFSFTGWYWNRQLKTYRAYVTDLKRVAVLTFYDRRVVVSPDDPDRFCVSSIMIQKSHRLCFSVLRLV